MSRLEVRQVERLTCLVDLVAKREASQLVGVVRNKLDVEDWAGGDDGSGSNVVAVFQQQVCVLRVAVADLDEVIPGWNTQPRGFSQRVVIVHREHGQ